MRNLDNYERESERRTIAVSHPRIVGVAPYGERSANYSWYELLVTGHDGVGALSIMTSVLAEHGVNLAPSGGYYTIAPGSFVWTTFANFSDSNSSLEYVTKDLKNLSFVTDVAAVKLDGLALDRFLFPVVIADSLRGIILPLEPILQVERRVIKKFGTAGAALIFDEGRLFAIENLKYYSARPELDQDAILAEVVSWLRVTGWGIFEFDTSRFEKEGKVGVTIFEPPNAVNSEFEQSHFTSGATAGIIEAVFGKKVRLVSSDYNAARKVLRLSFEVVA